LSVIRLLLLLLCEVSCEKFTAALFSNFFNSAFKLILINCVMQCGQRMCGYRNELMDSHCVWWSWYFDVDATKVMTLGSLTLLPFTVRTFILFMLTGSYMIC